MSGKGTISPNTEDPQIRANRIATRISVIQTVLAVSGFFVAIIALYAALNESDAVRKQQQASVWPHIQIAKSFEAYVDRARVAIYAQNAGIGPARIIYIQALVNGKGATNWFDAVEMLVGEQSISTWTIADTVLSPEQNIRLMETGSDAPDAAVRILNDAFQSGNIVVKICYCSVFDECWMTELLNRKPRPIDQCPAQPPEVSF